MEITIMAQAPSSSLVSMVAAHVSDLSCSRHATPIVFVVDDDASVRESVASLLDAAGLASATFGSATEFLATSRPTCPSCLVLDVMMPDLSGLELQERLTAANVDLPVIFITAYGDIPMTVRAMKRGALEFLTKPFRGDVLVSAVGRALEYSRAMLDDQVEIRALRQRYGSLSRRERQVMALVVGGRSNKQVAWELNICEITVKAHRGKMMRKMNARSLADLVRMAARIDAASPVLRGCPERSLVGTESLAWSVARHEHCTSLT